MPDAAELKQVLQVLQARQAEMEGGGETVTETETEM